MTWQMRVHVRLQASWHQDIVNQLQRCLTFYIIWLTVSVFLKVWQRLQRIECLAEQISAAQAGKSPGAAAESSPPLNALNHSANRAATRGL
jgi:hypothetical protein